MISSHPLNNGYTSFLSDVCRTGEVRDGWRYIDKIYWQDLANDHNFQCSNICESLRKIMQLLLRCTPHVMFDFDVIGWSHFFISYMLLFFVLLCCNWKFCWAPYACFVTIYISCVVASNLNEKSILKSILLYCRWWHVTCILSNTLMLDLSCNIENRSLYKIYKADIFQKVASIIAHPVLPHLKRNTQIRQLLTNISECM